MLALQEAMQRQLLGVMLWELGLIGLGVLGMLA
jgi:hypothetical protein